MVNNEPAAEGRMLLWAADWLTLLLLTAGLLFPCLSAYGISGQYGFDLGEVLAFCVFGSMAAAAIFTWRHGYWAALAVLAAEGLVFWRLWAHMEENWRRVRAPGLADLVEESAAALFLLYGLAVLVLGWIVVRARAWWLAAAVVILPVVPAIQSGVLPSWGAMLAGFAGWGAMLLTGLFGRKDPGSLGRARFLSLAGIGALMLILVMALPMEGYTRPQWATDARDHMIRSVSRQLERFFDSEDLENNLLTQLGLDLTIAGEGSGPGNGYGWGGGTTESVNTGMGAREDLRKVGPRRFTERLLLRVNTNQPDPAGRVYLRGVSFGVYTGSSWESAAGPDGVQPEQFPPLTAPDAPVYTMHIQDLGFWGTWYYPYRYNGGGQLDGDGRLTLAWDLNGLPLEYWALSDSREKMPVEEYDVSYRPGGPENGFIPLEGSWLAEEAAYRNSVLSTTYLSVPDKLESVLEPLVEELQREAAVVDGRLPEQFQPVVAAASRTAGFLASQAVYDPNTPAMEEESDFVTHFLEERRGFCVHFATAGTMLLRMQGIPARYVNGYVAKLDSHGMATVRDSDAHAWVEIYLDGYGWYPVDMTPGYAGGASGVGLEGAAGAPETVDEPVSEAAKEDASDEEEESSEEETPEAESGKEPPEEDEAPSEEEAVKKTVPLIIWKALFGVAVFWAALCAAYLLAQMLRERARRDGNANRSVLNAFGRYKRLRRWGCGEDDELERLAKKAKFSQHTLTDEERETAWKCLDEDLRQSRVGQPVRRRWILALLSPVF